MLTFKNKRTERNQLAFALYEFADQITHDILREKFDPAAFKRFYYEDSLNDDDFKTISDRVIASVNLGSNLRHKLQPFILIESIETLKHHIADEISSVMTLEIVKEIEKYVPSIDDNAYEIARLTRSTAHVLTSLITIKADDLFDEEADLPYLMCRCTNLGCLIDLLNEYMVTSINLDETVNIVFGEIRELTIGEFKQRGNKLYFTIIEDICERLESVFEHNDELDKYENQTLPTMVDRYVESVMDDLMK